GSARGTVRRTRRSITDENSEGDELRARRRLHCKYPEVPPGHAGRQFWESPAHADRDANMSALSYGTDRHHSATCVGRARRGRCRGIARNASDNARLAWPLAYLQQHSTDDHVSPRVLAAKPGAFRKTQGLGRHASRPGAARATHQRATAKLFFVAALSESKQIGSAVADRRYSLARSKIASIRMRDAS